MAEPSKGESIATLEDFRRFGGEFGIKTAKRAMEDLARQDVKTWWQHFTTVVLAEKEVHLRAIGATDEEIQIYRKSAADTVIAFVDDAAREAQREIDSRLEFKPLE